MADSGVNVPSGMGGLTRFKEGYQSKFDLKPTQVLIFILLIVVFRIALQIFVK
jgi:preprotein translocase subunit Sec61beta